MSVVANVAINIDGKQASAILDEIKRKVEEMNGTFDRVPQAVKNIDGLNGAVAGLATRFLGVTAIVAGFQKSIETAFARGAAEQRLKNLSGSTEEYQAALAAAASASEKFGISQTEATTALADVYGRLKGVGFGLKETTQIYEGFNVVAKQSGLAASDAAGVFFQLSQALGKGKLNGDEFVSVSERMPGLLDSIAQQTGRSRGELAAMAQQGEITSTVLYKALAQSANSAGNLNAKLTEQQVVFNSLRRASDEAFNSIGKIFGPIVVAAAKQLTEALSVLYKNMPQITAGIKGLLAPLAGIAQVVLPALQGALGAVFGNFKAIIQISTFFVTFKATLAGIALAMQAIQIATQAYANAQKVAAAAAAAFQAIMNPANLLKIPLALGAAALVSRQLGIEIDKAAQAAKGTKNETKEISGSLDQVLAKYSGLPPKIEDSKDKAKELKQEIIGIKGQYQELAAGQDALTTALDNSLNVAKSRYEAERAINDVLIGQLRTQLDQAASQEERIKIARRIYSLEIANAEAALKIALQQITAEVTRAQIAIQTQKLKLEELQVELALLKSRKEDTTELERALRLQGSALSIAISNESATKQIAQNQIRGADAAFQAQKNAAELAFQQNIAANAASRFADNLQSAVSIGAQGPLGLGKPFQLGIRYEGPSFTVPISPKSTGAGKSIVPESSAASFSENYLSGARNATVASSAASPAINITTGPVMQQNGQNYITMQDFEQGLQTMASSLLGNNRSAGGRRYAGVS